MGAILAGILHLVEALVVATVAAASSDARIPGGRKTRPPEALLVETIRSQPLPIRRQPHPALAWIWVRTGAAHQSLSLVPQSRGEHQRTLAKPPPQVQPLRSSEGLDLVLLSVPVRR